MNADQAPPESSSAKRGQIVVLFAFYLIAMMGVLGLAIDLGYSFAQRRAMQGAADAAALAGARAVAKWMPSAQLSAAPDVDYVVSHNGLGNTTPKVLECSYVDYYNNVQGGCGASVPPGATGVRVRVEETHSTFFIQIVPGAPRSVTIRATATAQVQRLRFAGFDSPFIVCGVNTRLASGGALSILNGATVNSAAVGQTFRIHGPQVQDCGLGNNSFKGRALQNSNVGKQVNQPGDPQSRWWWGDNGVAAGPTRVKVFGIEGCAINTPSPYNCIMLIPVAQASPAPVQVGGNFQFFVPQVLAFRVTTCGANCHDGTLLDDYVAFGAAASTWCRDCGGVVVVRLTE